MSFLSSNFQCNQKLSQDKQGHVALTPFHSCPSKNGMGATELGAFLYCPLYSQLPDVGQEGGTLLAAAETPGYLGHLEKGAGGDTAPLQVEVSFYKSSLPKATAIPFSASLRFKPKPVFLYLKKKKVKTKHNTSQVVTLGPSLSLSLSPSLFPSIFLSTCPFLIGSFASYFSHSLSGII